MNDGLLAMRVLAMKSIYTKVYKFESAHLQILFTIIFLPWNLKFLWGIIIDLNFASSRFYIVFFGLIASGCQFAAGFQVSDDHRYTSFFLGTANFAQAFLDSLIAQIALKEARIDPIYG